MRGKLILATVAIGLTMAALAHGFTARARSMRVADEWSLAVPDLRAVVCGETDGTVRCVLHRQDGSRIAVVCAEPLFRAEIVCAVGAAPIVPHARAVPVTAVEAAPAVGAGSAALGRGAGLGR